MNLRSIKTIPFLLAVFLSACGEDGNRANADQYIRVNLNGTEDLYVKGSTGSFDADPILANVTIEDNGALKANTVQIGAAEIDEKSSTASRTLSISLQGITAPGTYDLVENEGMLTYSTSMDGAFSGGYTISLEEHGSCKVTIEKISSNVRPGIGRPIKGTFSATVVIDDEGNTHTLRGEFNGGV